MRDSSTFGGWRGEIQKWTWDFEHTQRQLSFSQLIHGAPYLDKWLPYFGGNPEKMLHSEPNWLRHPVSEPYTLTFVSSSRWLYVYHTGTQWQASFDPGGRVEVKETRGMYQIDRVTKLSVDFHCPFRYAEERHKDDVATLKKKWKYL